MIDTRSADDVVLAEASAWVARLQGPERTPAAEAAFKAWLAADSAHARAFARATEVWEVIPGAARYTHAEREPGKSVQRPTRFVHFGLAAVATAVVAIVAVAVYQLRPLVYTTAVGQQQTLMLEDGTSVLLNTDSKLSVRYSATERRLKLVRGEALFQVAKDPQRPLVVHAGAKQVRALGTRFVVRKDEESIAVTLIDGQVEVDGLAQAASEHSARLAVRLSPGERLTIKANAVKPEVDKPRMEAVTAWQRGEVMFDDVSLREAVAEINRYGKLRLIVAEPVSSQLRVSGVFETRNPLEFARAMAQLHRLGLRSDSDSVTLSIEKMSGSMN